MRSDGLLRHFQQLAARASLSTADLTVKTQSSVVIRAIDFTCPTQNGSVIRAILDPSGTRTPLSAAQSDKVVTLPVPLVVPGPATIRVELDNSNGSASAYLGVTIYYEEL